MSGSSWPFMLSPVPLVTLGAFARESGSLPDGSHFTSRENDDGKQQDKRRPWVVQDVAAVVARLRAAAM